MKSIGGCHQLHSGEGGAGAPDHDHTSPKTLALLATSMVRVTLHDMGPALGFANPFSDSASLRGEKPSSSG